MGMVRVAVDDATPLDRCSSVLLNAGNHVLRRALEIDRCVFGGNDDLENALISCPLPTVGQRSERMCPGQAEAIGLGHLWVVFQTLFSLLQAVAPRAFSLDISAVGLPAARCPGRRIADIHNGSTLEG